MTDDRTLLRQMRRGSQNAATQLWARHAPGLLLYARSMLPTGTVDADDAVQQAFCRVFELPMRRIREVREVRAWLASVVRSIALNAMRSDKRETARRDHVSAGSSNNGSPATTPRDPTLELAIQGLGPEHREAVVLRHMAGLTFDQMSIATGENRSTVASRYRAALALLKEQLADERAASGQMNPARTASPVANPQPLGEPRHA